MRDHYTIDLKEKNLPIRTYHADMIKEDLKLLGYKKPMDLDLSDGYRTKIFKTEEDAKAWRTRYIAKRDHLLKSAKSAPGMPKMLLKRNFIVLTALGEKLITKRSYNREWQPGTLFQFNDQTIFYTVKLTKIVEERPGCFAYHYEA